VTPNPNEPAGARRPTSTAALLFGHARPRGMWWVASLPVIGFGFAHWDYALFLRNGGSLAVLFVAWLALHAGTMWLNAALDRDEGAVLLGEPLPVPAGIERYALGALALAVVLACIAGPIAGVCAAGCAVMAVMYSHPAWALKGHPLGGPVVNLVGYGVLSPIAGWSLVGVALDLRTVLAFTIVGCAIGGAYFAAQAFQANEDRARGYRTFVVTAGPTTTLWVARAFFAAAFLLAGGLAAAGWFPRACLLVLPGFLLIDRHMAAWLARGDGGTGDDARRLIPRLLLAGALLIGGAYAEYVREALAGEPIAGMGTAAGRPVDP
jgi:4-hydroxybenzoate polyprenyltransferase